MRSQDQAPLAGIRRARLFALKNGLKIAAVLGFEFLSLRIIGPELINRRQDLALFGAVIVFAAAILAAGWLVFQLRADIRLLKAQRREPPRQLH
jgi:hypothetical protein